MKTILIVGLETVVGANLVASWSDQERLLGISAVSDFHLPGCETLSLERLARDAIEQCLQTSHADHVVFCGAAARSTWEPRGHCFADSDAELWEIGRASCRERV